MATNTTLQRAPGDVSYSDTGIETNHNPGRLSSWLTGLMLLIIIALAASLLNSAAILPRSSADLTGPMVLPEGSTMPGPVQIRDGNQQALDAIAGMPAANDAAPGVALDSRINSPKTDKLPGRDDRKPESVPAPL